MNLSEVGAHGLGMIRKRLLMNGWWLEQWRLKALSSFIIQRLITGENIPFQVKPFQTRYSVFNFSPSTKSHCDCDEMFYDCLKKVNSSKADAVGDVFFNVLGIQCVEERLGQSCYKNTKAEVRAENMTSQSRSFIIPGLAVRINNAPSPPENCENPRLFVINTKRKY